MRIKDVQAGRNVRLCGDYCDYLAKGLKSSQAVKALMRKYHIRQSNVYKILKLTNYETNVQKSVKGDAGMD